MKPQCPLFSLLLWGFPKALVGVIVEWFWDTSGAFVWSGRIQRIPDDTMHPQLRSGVLGEAHWVGGPPVLLGCLHRRSLRRLRWPLCRRTHGVLKGPPRERSAVAAVAAQEGPGSQGPAGVGDLGLGFHSRPRAAAHGYFWRYMLASGLSCGCSWGRARKGA